MSHHPSARELHDAREDHRNEASARVRQAVRLDDALTAGRLAGELHVRRLGALQNTSGLPSLDFDGCIE